MFLQSRAQIPINCLFFVVVVYGALQKPYPRSYQTAFRDFDVAVAAVGMVLTKLNALWLEPQQHQKCDMQFGSHRGNIF